MDTISAHRKQSVDKVQSSINEDDVEPFAVESDFPFMNHQSSADAAEAASSSSGVSVPGVLIFNQQFLTCKLNAIAKGLRFLCHSKI